MLLHSAVSERLNQLVALELFNLYGLEPGGGLDGKLQELKTVNLD